MSGSHFDHEPTHTVRTVERFVEGDAHYIVITEDDEVHIVTPSQALFLAHSTESLTVFAKDDDGSRERLQTFAAELRMAAEETL